jgi:hypothetical protein
MEVVAHPWQFAISKKQLFAFADSTFRIAVVATAAIALNVTMAASNNIVDFI